MRNILLGLSLLIGLLAIASCDNSTAAAKKAASNATQIAAPAVPHSLPSITLAEMQRLYERCDFIDFIFFHMDFSMSVNEKSNVQRVITFVDKAQPNPAITCPAMGRLVYQSGGKILMEADMHYAEDCYSFVFYKDEKKVFVNKMTEQGKNYFQQMFNQVKVVPTKQ